MCTCRIWAIPGTAVSTLFFIRTRKTPGRLLIFLHDRCVLAFDDPLGHNFMPQTHEMHGVRCDCSAILQFLIETLPKAEEEEQEEVGRSKEFSACRCCVPVLFSCVRGLCSLQVVVGPRAMLNRGITRALKRFCVSVCLSVCVCVCALSHDSPSHPRHERPSIVTIASTPPPR